VGRSPLRPPSASAERSFATGTPSLLRAMNERSVLEVIHHRGPLSRAQVARECGLSKPTVSLALQGLLEAGLVRAVGRSSGGKGPTAALYELNPGSGWVVGIDVGRHWVRAAIADISGTIVARRDERARVRSARTLIDQIGQIAHDLAREAGIRWRNVTHATVGSPGVFDPSRGVVTMAPNLPGWGRHGLVEAVHEELGTNVSFENDVNLAALGERARGHGRSVSDFAYLWVGTGVGLGLVLGGELYRGSRGSAGEIAYLPIGDGSGVEPASRRHGAFEEVAGADGLIRAARSAGMSSPLTGKRVFAAARKGDSAATKAVEAEAAKLAMAIALVVPIIDPELVILGGGIGSNGDLLLEPIERDLRALIPFRPRVVISALGEDAVLHGAVATALEAARDRVFSRPRRTEDKEAAG
jgi:predicted NBD/HSP70 family sugar kinase